MSTLIRRLRGVIVALVILALTATAALAGRAEPSTAATAADGLSRATEGPGSSIPVAGAPDEDADEDADADADEIEPADEAPAAADGVHPDNHGAVVSAAAQGATPQAFDNHGAYVRTIARDNAGQVKAAAARSEHSTGH